MVNKPMMLRKIAQQQQSKKDSGSGSSIQDPFFSDPEFYKDIMFSKFFRNRNQNKEEKQKDWSNSLWKNPDKEEESRMDKLKGWLDEHRYHMFSPGDWVEDE